MGGWVGGIVGPCVGWWWHYPLAGCRCCPVGGWQCSSVDGLVVALPGGLVDRWLSTGGWVGGWHCWPVSGLVVALPVGWVPVLPSWLVGGVVARWVPLAVAR